MADISMCNGDGCKDKNTCHRHTAQPSYFQSYLNYNPVNSGKCEHYIENGIFKQLNNIVNGKH